MSLSISVYTASGKYIGEISKWHLFVIKNTLFNWQVMGHNGNFHFHLVVIKIYSNNIFGITIGY